ncbi:MAG TPA: hypothetical protein VFA74_01945 [Terriglobales bacterium]|nr:hypothetical protein [Terriglobales bacterium]
MSYVQPQEVLSPKNKVGGIVEVIHDPGEDHMCVARILWENAEVVAIRWNGNEERPLGNPVSTAKPTWLVVEEYAAAEVERAARTAAEQSPNSIFAKYREMANDTEREREAEEWTEGLISDASTPR